MGVKEEIMDYLSKATDEKALVVYEKVWDEPFQDEIA
jgi:hypothetical protein